MSNSIILKADNLVKTYQNNKKLNLEVLKSISLEIEENKISGDLKPFILNLKILLETL